MAVVCTGFASVRLSYPKSVKISYDSKFGVLFINTKCHEDEYHENRSSLLSVRWDTAISVQLRYSLGIEIPKIGETAFPAGSAAIARSAGSKNTADRMPRNGIFRFERSMGHPLGE